MSADRDDRIDPVACLHASTHRVPYTCKAAGRWFVRSDGGGWCGTAFAGSKCLSLDFDGAPFLEGFASPVARFVVAGI